MTFNFQELWSFYAKVCAAAGILTFMKPEDQTIFLKLYQKLCQFVFSLFVLSMVYTLVTQHTHLIVVIIASSGLVIYFAISAGPILLHLNHDEFMTVISWCQSFHNNNAHFDPKLEDLGKKFFEIAGHKSMKMMKIFSFLLAFDGFACTILFTFVANLLPGDTLLAEYQPPLPFDVPFYNNEQATPESFRINLFIQTAGIINGTLLGSVVMSIYFVIFIHLLTYLDVVLAIVGEFNGCLIGRKRNELLDSGEFVEVLYQIQETLESEADEFSTYTKIIVDMCSQFHEQMATFSDFSSLIFLIWECTSLFTTFISGIILLLEQEHIVLAIGVSMANFFYLIVCYVNSKILTKMSNINDALYNLPWYCMRPSERRKILLAKHTMDVQIGFSSGGFHDLNLEQFMNVTNPHNANSSLKLNRLIVI
ncbi:hypothetical protein Bhyg_08228 [Pseudolycoriella hygida]|uniref:Odorant receptor n=1 Tax=Pseudolycoriella hygida TaxID=35572 RepID=A0A9Q0S4L3_9DIPT|nr:hypothetical protein Bhyg_08228 [Pseudolycoriella hygida]